MFNSKSKEYVGVCFLSVGLSEWNVGGFVKLDLIQ